ncbi:crotonyl-CoA carboxylase/reductase [Streptomyces samsunensis]|uniref:crotonyl-CoA carboxylase/reductase n=1 Tax=Streptomyces malaysiensis TaxID=92644 RepID=UPI0015824879|nr:crotonyl-CoA carboxylase/reductase [Streptomyces samsunensis]NUH42939.1 crotonyl-CoA carboxylase/reductase [Streptomyces samsunensis]
MSSLSRAVLDGASATEIEAAPVPATYLALHLRAEDTDMFKGVADKDVRKSLRLGQVPMPELAPDEVLVAVMASSINYNTVWSAMFEPIPTFHFLKQNARQGGWAARHDQPYHVLGSDCSAVVVRVGTGVRRWKPGDHVTVHPVHVDDQQPETHGDGMLGSEQRAWGFETNFGALAEYGIVRSTQLLPKPAHLTWEEAAVNPLCASTAYRMLVSDRGAHMKQGDIVLIWGASGGLGSYAIQFVKNGGGIPVAVVSSAQKEAAVRALGCDLVINRTELGITDEMADDPRLVLETGRKLAKLVVEKAGREPDIVFEHTGRVTFGLSVIVARRGGTVVTCGSSSGYLHTFDNRYLWMKLKKIVGSHGANYEEQQATNRLFESGAVVPAMSAVYPLAAGAEACRIVQTSRQVGKVAVLCMAPELGLGVTDPELRGRIGEDRLNPLRGLTAGPDSREL